MFIISADDIIIADPAVTMVQSRVIADGIIIADTVVTMAAVTVVQIGVILVAERATATILVDGFMIMALVMQ